METINDFDPNDNTKKIKVSKQNKHLLMKEFYVSENKLLLAYL